MPELTLKHVAPEWRKLGEPYISHDIHGSVIFVDCDISVRVSNRQSFVWSIGFDKTTNELTLWDSKMRSLKTEEFIELVTLRTPQYLTALLFLLPNPANYFEELR